MRIFKTLILVAISTFAYSQNSYFPQEKINKAVSIVHSDKLPKTLSKTDNSIKSESGIFKALEFFNNFNTDFKKICDKKFYKKSNDTLVIGEVPGDTVIIKGKWNHTGPIYVLNDGVLIFKNAEVHDTGDIYVFGNGKMFADSTVFNFPQKYFYERGLLIIQNAKAIITNCSFYYSGMSHTLYLANNADLQMKNVKFKDWTTCGMFGSPKLVINGCNLSGEYILSDKCSATFLNADTLILWHQIPDKAEIDFAFPNGDFVKNYKFNNNISGINGIDYFVEADSCSTVMWALMPVNGSKVKISNSKIRLIGNWFMRGDSAYLKGIFNNSHYTDYTVPLNDRLLRLVNSDVQTWSMYVFDNSKIMIDSCVLGEVGSQSKSVILAKNYVCDGSGGYFWATDTSVIFANNVIVYTTVRSERNALVLLANSWLPFSAPSAIQNSILISSQNRLASPPVAFDRSVVWSLYIDFADSVTNKNSYNINGSAWIKQGPGGNALKFDSYSLSYRSENENKWNSIVPKNKNQIDDTVLGIWNVGNLPEGFYILKLTVKDNFSDTVDAFKVVFVEQSTIGLYKYVKKPNVIVFPNPADDFITLKFNNFSSDFNVTLYNSFGKILRIYEDINSDNFKIQRENIPSGVYFLKVSDSQNQSSIFRIVFD